MVGSHHTFSDPIKVTDVYLWGSRMNSRVEYDAAGPIAQSRWSSGFDAHAFLTIILAQDLVDYYNPGPGL